VTARWFTEAEPPPPFLKNKIVEMSQNPLRYLKMFTSLHYDLSAVYYGVRRLYLNKVFAKEKVDFVCFKIAIYSIFTLQTRAQREN